jgi:hypothetical protein
MRFTTALFALFSLLVGTVFAASHGESHTAPRAAFLADKDAAIAFHEQFIGTWDVSYEIYDKNGNIRHNLGQVVCSWIIPGQALQEVWSGDSHSRDFQPYGTTIGFLDQKHGQWTEVWIYPEQGMTTVVSGGEEHGGIVLTGRNAAGALERWSTIDIRPNSYVSRFEVSEDGGKTWRLVGVNHTTRHGSNS